MYKLKALSKFGIVRYVSNRPIGRDNVQYVEDIDKAHIFVDFATACLVRDDSLQDNAKVDILSIGS